MLLGWLLLFLVWVLPFAVLGQPETTVSAIASDWPVMLAVQWTLGVLTVACMAARLTRDVRRWAASESPDFSALWGTVFHVALLLLAMSLVLAETTTKVSKMELIEGQSVAEFRQSTGVRIDPSALILLGDMRLSEVDPQFFESYLLFQKLAARVEWRGQSHAFTLARPLWLDPVTYVSIQDFGYAPTIETKAAGSEVVESSTRSLSLFPPGTEDTVDAASLFANVTLRVFPDYAVIGGKDASKSFNLVNPRIRITVIQNAAGLSDSVIARRLVKIGEPVVLPDGSSITVAEIRKAGTFSVVRCPALPWVALSAALLMVSVFFRLTRPRAEVAGTEVN